MNAISTAFLKTTTVLVVVLLLSLSSTLLTTDLGTFSCALGLLMSSIWALRGLHADLTKSEDSNALYYVLGYALVLIPIGATVFGILVNSAMSGINWR